MIRIVHRPVLSTVLLLAMACGGPPAEPGATSDAEHTATRPEPQDGAPAHGAEHEHGATGAGAAHEELPLRTIMQQLASDLAGFSYALWLEDFDAMTAHAAAMADHPHISPDDVQRIQAALGPEMAAFEEADEAVHLASVRMHGAAEARQRDDVLDQLAEVQRGCVSCHTRFRDRLRTDTTATATP